jgi:hypothetical protein
MSCDMVDDADDGAGDGGAGGIDHDALQVASGDLTLSEGETSVRPNRDDVQERTRHPSETATGRRDGLHRPPANRNDERPV